MTVNLERFKTECEEINLPLSTKIPEGMKVTEFLEVARETYNMQQRFSRKLSRYVQSNMIDYKDILSEKELMKEYSPENVSKLLMAPDLTPWEKQFLLDNSNKEELSEKQMKIYKRIVDKVNS